MSLDIKGIKEFYSELFGSKERAQTLMCTGDVLVLWLWKRSGRGTKKLGEDTKSQ